MEEAAIDGSAGEGGGQILRTALTVSCVTGRPVKIDRIRAGRPNPGMRAQHVAAASALAAACGARTSGLHVGSTGMRFEPGKGAGGGGGGGAANDSGSGIRCDVGTAGSTTLILSALVVAASLRGEPLEAVLTGGTDVAWSPTAGYTSLALREALSRMGIKFSMAVERRGYYPEGGGVVRASIEACEGGGRPRPAVLPGRLSRRASLHCSYAGLPADRIAGALGQVADMLKSAGCAVEPGWEGMAEEAGGRPQEEDRQGGRGRRRKRERGGAAAVAFSADAGSVIGADSLYREGRFDADGMAARFSAPGIGADANLADMLVVPAALARGRSRFVAPEITGHLETNLRVAADMTGCRYGAGRTGDGAYEVIIDGSS